MKANLPQLLGFAIISLLAINFITPSLASEQDTSLTLKPSHASIYFGEQIRFTGKLVDGLGYAISGVPISIWDIDGSSYESVGSTTTDARGEFELSVTALYWDGPGVPVEILAYFPGTSSYYPSKVRDTFNLKSFKFFLISHSMDLLLARETK